MKASYSRHYKDAAEGHVFLDKPQACTIQAGAEMKVITVWVSETATYERKYLDPNYE